LWWGLLARIWGLLIGHVAAGSLGHNVLYNIVVVSQCPSGLRCLIGGLLPPRQSRLLNFKTGAIYAFGPSVPVGHLHKRRALLSGEGHAMPKRPRSTSASAPRSRKVPKVGVLPDFPDDDSSQQQSSSADSRSFGSSNAGFSCHELDPRRTCLANPRGMAPRHSCVACTSSPASSPRQDTYMGQFLFPGSSRCEADL
jgi:hypothetical protein